MQSKSLGIESPQRRQTLSHSRSIREHSQRQSSSNSDKKSSIHNRIRRASAHQFAKEIEQFQKAHDEKKHPLKAIHSLPFKESLAKEALSLDEKDHFLKSRIYDELETHFHCLQKQQIPEEGQNIEDLQYTTFRMVKRQQKTQLSQLRQKFLQKHHQEHQ